VNINPHRKSKKHLWSILGGGTRIDRFAFFTVTSGSFRELPRLLHPMDIVRGRTFKWLKECTIKTHLFKGLSDVYLRIHKLVGKITWVVPLARSSAIEMSKYAKYGLFRSVFKKFPEKRRSLVWGSFSSPSPRYHLVQLFILRSLDCFERTKLCVFHSNLIFRVAPRN
jgi:hypothetical protein